MGSAKYKQKHRESGLCLFCSRPVLKNHLKCAEHLFSSTESTKKYYRNNRLTRLAKRHQEIKHRKENNLCRDCGGKLDLDADTNRVTCINCRERIRGGIGRDIHENYKQYCPKKL
jgi:hypothetical protein